MGIWMIVFFMGMLPFSVAFSTVVSFPQHTGEDEIQILQDQTVCQPENCVFLQDRAEASYTTDDQIIFKRYIDFIHPWQSSPFDKILEKTALFFLDYPYVAYTLEVPGEEKLVVNLREFDCTTFVETVIALARTVHSGNRSFDKYLNELRQIRYRNGIVDGYMSRLHYTSDWLYDNEKNGILKNSSARLGGILEEKTIDFMGTHRDAYQQLKNDDLLLLEIQEMEDEINNRGGFYYLPKENIARMASEIPHMSVVAFTTSIKGLDVTHMGFAFHEGNRLTFIHASSVQKKVVIDHKTLSNYCAGQSSCNGIIVCSLNSH